MSISAIKSQYYAIADRLNAPTKHIRFATSPQHDGSPHIEANGADYYFIVTERGVELERQTTTEPEDILYWLVSDLTWSMASDYELSHREIALDSRRLLFQKHLELLAAVSLDWSNRKRLEYESVLRKHPFSDKLYNSK